MRHALAGVATAAVVASLLAALASLAPGSPATASCAGAGPNHAALVVEHGDGSVVTRCVAFAASQISGEQLLDGAGVAWSAETFGGFGDAVCALDGEPAHYSTCPGKDFYWAVFVSRGGGGWQFAATGISALTLADGDAEGFRYVASAGTAAAPPSPAGVCAAAAGSPIPGATQAATATPAAPAAPTRSAAARTGAGATPRGTAGAAESSGAAASGAESANATTAGSDASGSGGPATPSASATAAAAEPAPATAGTGGLDAGLLLAALAGGGLLGLALLRLMAMRRAP
jgi:hypothetical protein